MLRSRKGDNADLAEVEAQAARSRQQASHDMAGLVQWIIVRVQLGRAGAEGLQAQGVPARIGRRGHKALLPQTLDDERIASCAQPAHLKAAQGSPGPASSGRASMPELVVRRTQRSKLRAWMRRSRPMLMSAPAPPWCEYSWLQQRTKLSAAAVRLCFHLATSELWNTDLPQPLCAELPCGTTIGQSSSGMQGSAAAT